MYLHRRALLAVGVGVPFIAVVSRAAEIELQAGLKGLSRFIGRWRGTGDGQAGRSVVERIYEPQLGGKFLHVRNTSTYAPQEKNPKGEVHHDVGFFSFDNARKRAVLRQFHIEGFVNQYAAVSEALDGPELVFETESIENIPPGFKARETYRFEGRDAFEEIFEIAEPGKTFEVYTHNRFKRA